MKNIFIIVWRGLNWMQVDFNKVTMKQKSFIKCFSSSGSGYYCAWSTWSGLGFRWFSRHLQSCSTDVGCFPILDRDGKIPVVPFESYRFVFHSVYCRGPVRPRHFLNLSISLTFFMLDRTTLASGTCWSILHRSNSVGEALGLKVQQDVIGVELYWAPNELLLPPPLHHRCLKGARPLQSLPDTQTAERACGWIQCMQESLNWIIRGQNAEVILWILILLIIYQLY